MAFSWLSYNYLEVVLTLKSPESKAFFASVFLHVAVALAFLGPRWISEPRRTSSIMDLDIRMNGAKQAVARTRSAPVVEKSLGQKASATKSVGAHDVIVAQQDLYILELRNLIEGLKSYPLASKRMREQGRAVVSFLIAKDGSISNILLKGSSGFARLDEASLAIVRTIGRFRAFPNDLKRDALSIDVPIEYILDN